MITNTGKGILAKYLIGQAPSYASYIAVGCGPQALNSEEPGFTPEQIEEYSAKNALDFEMFRVPIISRGYVNDGGDVKLVLTAELPTEERYEITEVGVFSAGSNPSAGAFDSKSVYSFTETEGWEYHTSGGLIETIPTVYAPLDSSNDNVITGSYIVNGTLKQTPVFHTNADNRTFTNTTRVNRNERCRFLNNMVMIRGNDSVLSKNQAGHLDYGSGNHIHITNASFNFNKNAPTDELKFAFSVVNKDSAYSTDPDNVKILVEFSSSDTSSSGEHAKFSVNLDNEGFSGDGDETVDFGANRYFVVSKQLQELSYTSGFNWDVVTTVRIYVSVKSNGAVSDKYYVALDSLRLENTSTSNPLYGMTGYSVMKTDGALPIVKLANTSNFIEFRIAIGVE
jgi:hypothetical protein